MNKIKCLIVEDEPLAAKLLADYVAQVSSLELTGICKDAISAAEWLSTRPTDLIFLDIHLPKLKGLDFLKTLVIPPSVIVTTAYHQYAVESFALNVTDYLLKPFGFERFLQAVNKVKMVEDQMPKDFIFLMIQKKYVKIKFDDILFIESQREYIRIVTIKKEYRAKMSTHEVQSLLPDTMFQRVHRSYIVALDRIDAYNAETIDIQDFAIPIGREFKAVVERL